MSLAAVTIAAMLASTLAAQDAPLGRARDDGAPPATAPNSTATRASAARASVPAATATTGDPTGDQIAEWLKADAAPVLPLDPRFGGPAEITSTRRQIHGEVGAVVSNRGYAGYAATSVPLGDASELDLGVSAGQFKTPWGRRVNPKSVSVGLFLDGRDVQRWISRDKCNVPRWGVRLPDDPEVAPDGSCVRPDRIETKGPAAGPPPAP